MATIEQKRKWNNDFYHRNKDRLNEKRKKPKHKVNCKHCDKEFETARPNQKFCSAKCQHRWHYEKKDKYILPIKQKAISSVIGRMAERKRKEYTKDELKFIKKNYKKMTVKELAIELKRPYGGMRWKVAQIKKDDELKKHYGSW